MLDPAAPGARWMVSCDFDGTITCNDMVLSLLADFAGDGWRASEADWEAGRIGSRECLERQTRLLKVSPAALARWVDLQPIDPQVPAFFADCAERGWDVRIVSDGYDWVIRRAMARLDLQAVPVFANRLVPIKGDRWALEFPYARPGCASGACKCGVVSAAGRRLHIGDGRSDMCVSDACDVVFAKGSLLASRTARGRASIPFADFADIRAALPALAAQPCARRDQPPRRAAC